MVPLSDDGHLGLLGGTWDSGPEVPDAGDEEVGPEADRANRERADDEHEEGVERAAGLAAGTDDAAAVKEVQQERGSGGDAADGDSVDVGYLPVL
ncbi:hypothetical protein [Catenulispora sp. MAP5-51]|uniref:hypothetical protein n=1 Tax=Catenulispora sp. MAP5-51 TaxID=3156298 RepID=UPI003518B3A7